MGNILLHFVFCFNTTSAGALVISSSAELIESTPQGMRRFNFNKQTIVKHFTLLLSQLYL